MLLTCSHHPFVSEYAPIPSLLEEQITIISLLDNGRCRELCRLCDLPLQESKGKSASNKQLAGV